MRIPTKHELIMTYWGDPSALIIKRENLLEYVRVLPMREYFICQFGIFKWDTTTMYRHNKQPLSIYNSHGTLIPEKIVERIHYDWRKKEYIKTKEELEKIYPNILKGKDYKTIFEVFADIVDEDEHYAIDIDTEKYLQHFRSYNPISIKKLNEVCHAAKKGIDSLSPPALSKALSFGVMIMVGLIIFAVIQSGPKYIRELQEWMGG